eukprot:scaffold447153_cov19-Prasinocladus_malaysianus.AAC.1
MIEVNESHLSALLPAGMGHRAGDAKAGLHATIIFYAFSMSEVCSQDVRHPTKDRNYPSGLSRSIARPCLARHARALQHNGCMLPAAMHIMR